MNNIEFYIKLINISTIIDYIIYFCAICILINFIISLIMSFSKNKKELEKNKKEESNYKFGFIEIIGGIILSAMTLSLLLIIIKFNIALTIISIPSIILLFYTIYIRPMTYRKSSTFIFDYYEYGAVLAFSLYYFKSIDLVKIISSSPSEGFTQVFCIVFLLIEVYCSSYCLFLNIYFVIKNLNKIGIYKIEKIYNSATDKLYDILGFDKIKIKFNFSNNLINDNNRSKIKKILMFLPNFILDIILCFLKYTTSALLSFIIKPIITIIGFFLSKIVQISSTDDNQINYKLTKLVAASSILIVYIALQISGIFQERIINTYEFISSVIVIPIILEELLSLKEKIKNNNN